MKFDILSLESDPMGAAIADYYRYKKADKLRLFSSQFDEDEMSVSQFFRSFKDMPTLEQTALTGARGKILDVGAGGGCHALALREMGKDVTPIDISPRSVEIIKEQGIDNVRHINLFDPALNDSYDTILMLMNGSGIIGKIQNIPAFLSRVRELLNPGGALYMDSSDLRYLFEDEEDGSFTIDLAGEYYGQIDFQLQYKDIIGEPFDWLYIDFDTLEMYASECGFDVELVQEGAHYDYLAKLTVR